jgi:two-component system, NtrC family, nitrogen regulation response regulator NtrX
LLANHFVTLICNEYGMPEKKITADAIAELKKINWTGNIREFRNVIERLIILCDRQIAGEDVQKFAAPLK